jgi:hypothetical protein
MFVIDAVFFIVTLMYSILHALMNCGWDLHIKDFLFLLCSKLNYIRNSFQGVLELIYSFLCWYGICLMPQLT